MKSKRYTPVPVSGQDRSDLLNLLRQVKTTTGIHCMSLKTALTAKAREVLTAGYSLPVEVSRNLGMAVDFAADGTYSPITQNSTK